ncbi:MAG: hypothetical protein ACI841_001985 [Planctomycetota bacterium]|jgi:hypothetical protein
MRPSNLFTIAGAIALGTLTLSARLVASPDATAPKLGISSQEEAEQDELHEAMEVMQGGMRRLRKLVSDSASKDATVKLVGEMQAAAVSAFGHAPDAPEGLEGKTLLTWKTDFNRKMLTLALQLVEVEEAVLKGDTERAGTLYSGLKAMKSAGHEKYEDQ